MTTKPKAKQPKAGMRVAYLVIIKRGDFGSGKGRCWVVAWESKADARKSAREWASSGYAHDVVEFREVSKSKRRAK